MTTDNKGAMTGEHCINCGLEVDPKCACSRGRADREARSFSAKTQELVDERRARIAPAPEPIHTSDAPVAWMGDTNGRTDVVIKSATKPYNMENAKPLVVLATHTAPAVDVRHATHATKKFLSNDDFADLLSFSKQVEDSDADGYTIPKETMRRLAELGIVQSHGFGRYSVTAFGHWVIETEFAQNPLLPLRTINEHNARELAGRNLYNKGMQPTAWVELPPAEREKWRVTAERELPTGAAKGEA